MATLPEECYVRIMTCEFAIFILGRITRRITSTVSYKRGKEEHPSLKSTNYLRQQPSIPHILDT